MSASGPSPLPAPLLERRLFRLGLALTAATFGAFAFPLLQGRAYVKDDLGMFHLPTRAFYAQALARGEGFLWFPGLFCGFSLHGEGQAGLLHPVHLLLYRALPLPAAFGVELLLSYAAALLGTFLFLRRLELRRDAALLGALLFAFCGFNLMHFVHPNMVAVIAHAPWLLWAIDHVLRGTSPRRRAAATLGAGVLTASQLLLGHPQAMWLSCVAEGLYALYRWPAAGSRSRILWLAQAKVLGVLAGAVQLLPTFEAVALSARAAPSFDFRYRASLDPVHLLQAVAPYLPRAGAFADRFVHEFAPYDGAVPLVLAAWLAARGRALGPRRGPAAAALALGALALVLALGQEGYLYRLHARLPVVGQFESAARFVVLAHLALAVGAGLAFADLASLLERREVVAWRRLWPLAAFPLLGLLLAAAALWLRAHPETAPAAAARLASAGPALAGPALLILAAVLVAAGARGRPFALAGLMVLAVADLVGYGLRRVREPFPPLDPALFVGGQAGPPDALGLRVHSGNNVLTLQGTRLAAGYAAFRPETLLDDLDGQRLRMAGVRWVQTRTPWAAGPEEPLAPELEASLLPETAVTHDALGRASSWRQVRDPMPRAWMVAEARASASPARDLAGLDLHRVALVAAPLSLGGGPPGVVIVAADRPGRVRITAVAPSRQLVVLSESWHAGWRVRVGGRPQDALRVNGDFLGAVVERGRQDVEFAFAPASLRRGAMLTVVALGLLLGTCLVQARFAA